MSEAARRLESTHFCMRIDLESSITPQDAVVRLGLASQPFASLWGRTKKVFSNVPDFLESVSFLDFGIHLRPLITLDEWEVKASGIINVMSMSEKPVILFLDEVPIFIHNLYSSAGKDNRDAGIAEVARFLRWLREMSQTYQGKVTFVLTGSIGLAPILQRFGLRHQLGNFYPFDLPPWDTKTCLDCLAALAHHEGVIFDAGASEKMMQLLGEGIPHYVQRFFDVVLAECQSKGQSGITIEDVENAYEGKMLGAITELDLANYYERLARVLGEEETPFAIELLTETAVKGKLSQKALESIRQLSGYEKYGSPEIQNKILGILEHDGYLKRSKTNWVFYSNLLRDWWKRRFGSGYVSLIKRAAK